MCKKITARTILHIWILFLITENICAQLPNTETTTSPCKNEFLRFGNSCFKLNKAPLSTFARAKSYCRGLGAELAVVDASDARNDVITLLRRFGYRDLSYWVQVENNVLDNPSIGEIADAADRCTVVGPGPSYAIEPVACESLQSSVCFHEAEASPTLQRSIAGGFSCFKKIGYFANPSNCSQFFLCYSGRKYTFSCATGRMFSEELGHCIAGTNCDGPSPDGDTENEDNDNNTICESGYRKLKSKCYKMFTTSTTWENASTICVDRENGRLALPKTNKIMKFLKKMVKNTRRNFWIGLNDKERYSQYAWNDGEILSRSAFSFWSKRVRRNKSRSKRCVKLDRRAKFKWMNANCNERNFFICEKDSVRQWSPSDGECGNYYKRGVPRIGQIIGGEEAVGEFHPWQVSLRLRGDHKCGGSLIDSCWVLTAAHCVTTSDGGLSSEKLISEAVLGDFDLLNPETAEERLEIDKIFVHPDWSLSPVPNNDIAVIKLRVCSELHNPICLPTSKEFRFSAGTRCIISGYGTTNPRRTVYPKKLLQAEVPIIARKQCKSLYKRRDNRKKSSITSAMFCAGYLEGKIDSCEGDSGGPLVCEDQESRRIQVGIVSWGTGCARAKRPGVYTQVANFYDWIRNVTYIDY